MAKRDLIRTVKTRNSSVICVETGELYQSMTDAAKALGITSVSNISRSIRDGGSVGGYHFKYADKSRNPVVLPTVTGRTGRDKPVVCRETGAVYVSMAEAARASGVPYSRMKNAVSSGNQINGLHFEFKNKKDRDSIGIRRPTTIARIACLETGEVFDSVKEAKRKLFDGTRTGDEISRAVRTGFAVKGLHFYLADEPKPDPWFFGMERVRCVETGKVYESPSAAAIDTGDTEAFVRGSALSDTEGFHYEKAGWKDEPVVSSGGAAAYSLEDVGKAMLEALGVGLTDIDLDGLREFVAQSAEEIKGRKIEDRKIEVQDSVRGGVRLKQVEKESRSAAAKLAEKNGCTDAPNGKDEH